MPNNSFLNSLLVPIQDLIMKSRPAYKDFLGRQTVTKHEEIYDGTIQGEGVPLSMLAVSTYDVGPDDIKSLLIAGEVYSVTIGSATENIAAREFSIDGIPLAVLSNLEKFPETEEEQANLPENYWLFIYISAGDMSAAHFIGAGTFVGRNAKVVREYDVVEEKYDTKLLPEELLPKGTVKKEDLESINAEMQFMANDIERVENLVTGIPNPDWIELNTSSKSYIRNRTGGYAERTRAATLSVASDYTYPTVTSGGDTYKNIGEYRYKDDLAGATVAYKDSTGNAQSLDITKALIKLVSPDSASGAYAFRIDCGGNYIYSVPWGGVSHDGITFPSKGLWFGSKVVSIFFPSKEVVHAFAPKYCSIARVPFAPDNSLFCGEERATLTVKDALDLAESFFTSVVSGELYTVNGECYSRILSVYSDADNIYGLYIAADGTVASKAVPKNTFATA